MGEVVPEPEGLQGFRRQNNRADCLFAPICMWAFLFCPSRLGTVSSAMLMLDLIYFFGKNNTFGKFRTRMRLFKLKGGRFIALSSNIKFAFSTSPVLVCSLLF